MRLWDIRPRPKPITRLTWDNAVLVSRATAGAKKTTRKKTAGRKKAGAKKAVRKATRKAAPRRKATARRKKAAA